MKYLYLTLLTFLFSCSKQEDEINNILPVERKTNIQWFYNQRIDLKHNATGNLIPFSSNLTFNTHHCAVIGIQNNILKSTAKFKNDSLICVDNMYLSNDYVTTYNFSSTPKKIYMTSDNYTLIFTLQPISELYYWRELPCLNR